MPTPPTNEQLKRLEAALRTINPEAKSKNAPSKSIAKIESLTGPLHSDVKALWSWGLAPDVFERGELGFDDEQVWLSVEDVARELEALRKVKEFPATLIPLSTDEAGNYTCHDLETGHVMDWDHETRWPRLLSKSLAGYLDPRRVKAERAVREAARAAKELAKPKQAPRAGAMPKGLRKVTRADLTRLDAKGYGGGSENAAMSEDGRWIAVGFRSSTALWDSVGGGRVEFGGREDRESSPLLAFDPSRARFVRGRWPGAAMIVETNGTVTHRWELDASPVRGGFSRDGTLVYSMSREALDVWRAEELPKAKSSGKVPSAKPLARLTPKSSIDCVDVGLADDGTFLLLQAAVYKYELTLWDTGSGESKKRSEADAEDWGSAVAISPDGTRAALGLSDGTIHLLSPRDGLEVTQVIKRAHDRSRGVTSLAYDPTGRVLVSSGMQDLKVWDATSGKQIAALAAKSKNHAPVLHVDTVTATHVLTSEPLALFEFRF